LQKIEFARKLTLGSQPRAKQFLGVQYNTAIDAKPKSAAPGCPYYQNTCMFLANGKEGNFRWSFTILNKMMVRTGRDPIKAAFIGNENIQKTEATFLRRFYPILVGYPIKQQAWAVVLLL
jgi:hypothetical protein